MHEKMKVDLRATSEDNANPRCSVHILCGHRREGLISRQAFFEGMIQEERNEFGNAIFTLVDPEDEETLEFG